MRITSNQPERNKLEPQTFLRHREASSSSAPVARSQQFSSGCHTVTAGVCLVWSRGISWRSPNWKGSTCKTGASPRRRRAYYSPECPCCKGATVFSGHGITVRACDAQVGPTRTPGTGARNSLCEEQPAPGLGRCRRACRALGSHHHAAPGSLARSYKRHTRDRLLGQRQDNNVGR